MTQYDDDCAEHDDERLLRRHGTVANSSTRDRRSAAYRKEARDDEAVFRLRLCTCCSPDVLNISHTLDFLANSLLVPRVQDPTEEKPLSFSGRYYVGLQQPVI